MRPVFLSICVFFISCVNHEKSTIGKPDQLEDGIQTAKLVELALDNNQISAMQDSIANGNYPNIHSVLIFYHNALVYENYWPGYDENRTTNSHGDMAHHRDSLHDIRSITKSIVSAAAMIALDQGILQSLDQPIFDFFPSFTKYAHGRKKDISIRHLLTMTSGLSWRESNNDSLKKHDVSYAIDFILRQALDSEPGSKFSYHSGSTQLIAQIIEKASGMDIENFVVKHLFNPLGITHFEWTKEKNGLISAWAGLRLRSRDMLKFGMLYLNEGKWNGKQIISSHLVEESIQSHISIEETYGYGYQFWILNDSIPNEWINTVEASGNGGQKIEINRSQGLIVVITAGNYGLNNLTNTSYDLYLDFICPAIPN